MTDDSKGDVTRIVDLFRAEIYAKLMLPKNVAKGSWMGMTPREIMLRIMDERSELSDAVSLAMIQPSRENFRAVLLEACDVAAFASFLCDPCGIAWREATWTDAVPDRNLYPSADTSYK